MTAKEGNDSLKLQDSSSLIGDMPIHSYDCLKLRLFQLEYNGIGLMITIEQFNPFGLNVIEFYFKRLKLGFGFIAWLTL